MCMNVMLYECVWRRNASESGMSGVLGEEFRQTEVGSCLDGMVKMGFIWQNLDG